MTLLLALLTLITQIALLGVLAIWAFKKEWMPALARHSHTLALTLFIGATMGSLYFSDIKGFAPCLLCWWQRVFIFGNALLLLTANLRKSALLRTQVITFSIIGGGIALIHNIIDIFPTGLDICGATGPSCLARYVYEFGYITIPMMSLTVLGAGLTLALIAKRYPQR